MGQLKFRGELGNGGRLEEGGQRQSNSQVALHSGEQGNGQKRVSSQIKKVLVDSDILKLEELTPDLQDLRFRPRSWELSPGIL